jgi:leader peptidase (prepilin peptidase)/N-methyltransferase
VNWTDPAHLEAAGLCLVVCGILGWLVPGLIIRVPEPEPANDPELDPALDPELDPGFAELEPAREDTRGGRLLPPPPPKASYVHIGAGRGLPLRTAAASGLCGLAVGAGTGWAWALLYLVPMVPVGVALTVIDWRTTLLPTRIVAPSYVLVVVGILVAAVLERDRESLVRAGLGWLIVGGFYLVLWLVHPAGMGYGDVRLSGVIGLMLGYLGWQELLVGSYAAFLVGGVGGAVLAALKVVKRKRFPFGPFMLLGALLGVAAGPELLAGLGY